MFKIGRKVNNRVLRNRLVRRAYEKGRRAALARRIDWRELGLGVLLGLVLGLGLGFGLGLGLGGRCKEFCCTSPEESKEDFPQAAELSEEESLE